MTTFEQLPDIVDWRVIQGDDLDFTVQLSTDTSPPAPLDLTGYTARADVRVDYRQQQPTASFTVTILDQVANKGQVRLHLAGEHTAALPPDLGCHYDLQLTSSSTRTYLRGTITALPESTRG